MNNLGYKPFCLCISITKIHGIARSKIGVFVILKAIPKLLFLGVVPIYISPGMRVPISPYIGNYQGFFLINLFIN